MSFQDDLKLDILDLDTAAINQPSLYHEIGSKWAEAVAERDHLKDQLSAVKAEVDELVRKDPDKFGAINGKTTETWIASKVTLHPDVELANCAYQKAVYNVNMLSVAKEALDHRLKALSILTELYKGNYFAASSRTSATHEQALDNSQEKQREKMETNPRMLKRLKRDGD